MWSFLTQPSIKKKPVEALGERMLPLICDSLFAMSDQAISVQGALLIKISKISYHKCNQHIWFRLNPKLQTSRFKFWNFIAKLPPNATNDKESWNIHGWKHRNHLNPKFWTSGLNFNIGVFLNFTPSNLPLLIKISKIWHQKWNQLIW